MWLFMSDHIGLSTLKLNIRVFEIRSKATLTLIPASHDQIS